MAVIDAPGEENWRRMVRVIDVIDCQFRYELDGIRAAYLALLYIWAALVQKTKFEICVSCSCDFPAVSAHQVLHLPRSCSARKNAEVAVICEAYVVQGPCLL